MVMDALRSKLISFGEGNRLYTFPDDLQASMSDNFTNAVPRTVRMPGMDGGFDEYGAGRAPKEIGNINFTFTLVADTEAEMKTKRDAVGAMEEWGVQKLIAKGGGTERRYTFARVNNIAWGKRLDAHTDYVQPVTINFQVADPYWYRQPTTGLIYGQSSYGSDFPAASASFTVHNPGAQQIVTYNNVNYDGNAHVFPYIRVSTATGQYLRPPFQIHRFWNNTKQEILTLNKHIGSPFHGTLWEIDGKRSRVAIDNSTPAYANILYTRQGFMRLDPGVNQLHFVIQPGSQFKLDISWHPRFHNL